MNNGLILLLTLLITSAVLIILYIILYKKKKKDKIKIEEDFEKFKKAISIKDIDGIDKYGKSIIYNSNLDMFKFNYIKQNMSEINTDNPKLKSLKLLIFNKELDWKHIDLNIGDS